MRNSRIIKTGVALYTRKPVAVSVVLQCSAQGNTGHFSLIKLLSLVVPLLISEPCHSSIEFFYVHEEEDNHHDPDQPA